MRVGVLVRVVIVVIGGKCSHNGSTSGDCYDLTV